jgi:hypothetical protein
MRLLATKSWASLEDGTPLVTGEHRGKGVVSLFHVSADMRWSDLPMSGSFVEMLRRIVDMSGYTSKPARASRRSRSRNGGAAAHARRFRRVRTAALDRKADAGGFPRSRDPDHPPGFYGPADGPLAVNTLAAADRIAPLDTRPARAAAATPMPSRAICAASCCRRRWRCS